MKKLYIGFILLGFLIFILPVAFGDLIILPEKEEIQKVKKQYEKDLLCINEKKTHLSEKYIGTNLKPENYKNIPYIFYDLHDHPGLYEDINLSSKKQYEVDTYFNALNNFDNPILYLNRKIEPNFGLVKQTSLAYNCKEYITLYSYNRPEGGGVYTNITAYDVTDVPQGSYLKYIHETGEFQVLPPTEESYKEIIESQKEQLKIRNTRIKAEQERKIALEKFKKKEKIKNKIFAIIFVLGIITLIAIFIKEIFRKFRR